MDEADNIINNSTPQPANVTPGKDLSIDKKVNESREETININVIKPEMESEKKIEKTVKNTVTASVEHKIEYVDNSKEKNKEVTSSATKVFKPEYREDD